jgi:hypothetical protein
MCRKSIVYSGCKESTYIVPSYLCLTYMSLKRHRRRGEPGSAERKRRNFLIDEQASK